MADRPSKEQWRSRIEHFLESDMSVSEWCAANRISSSAMFRRLNAFADEEPEIFGGAQNMFLEDMETEEERDGFSAWGDEDDDSDWYLT